MAEYIFLSSIVTGQDRQSSNGRNVKYNTFLASIYINSNCLGEGNFPFVKTNIVAVFS